MLPHFVTESTVWQYGHINFLNFFLNFFKLNKQIITISWEDFNLIEDSGLSSTLERQSAIMPSNLKVCGHSNIKRTEITCFPIAEESLADFSV